MSNNPFPNGAAYQAALYAPLYSINSPEGKAFRAETNQKLEASPNIMPGPNDERIRQQWLDTDRSAQ